jgi:N-methylhydantoinase A
MTAEGNDRVSAARATPIHTQRVRDTTTGEVADWPVYDRTSLATGVRITGPAIIAEDETSTLVGAGWGAVMNRLGYIELTRESA